MDKSIASTHHVDLAAGQPLAGLRVIDLSQVMAGQGLARTDGLAAALELVATMMIQEETDDG